MAFQTITITLLDLESFRGQNENISLFLIFLKSRLFVRIVVHRKLVFKGRNTKMHRRDTYVAIHMMVLAKKCQNLRSNPQI